MQAACGIDRYVRVIEPAGKRPLETQLRRQYTENPLLAEIECPTLKNEVIAVITVQYLQEMKSISRTSNCR